MYLLVEIKMPPGYYSREAFEGILAYQTLFTVFQTNSQVKVRIGDQPSTGMNLP